MATNLQDRQQAEEDLLNWRAIDGLRDHLVHRARATGHSIAQIHSLSGISHTGILLALARHKNHALTVETAPLVPTPVAIMESLVDEDLPLRINAIQPAGRAGKPSRSSRWLAVVVGIAVSLFMAVLGMCGIWYFNILIGAIGKPMTELFNVPLLAVVSIGACRAGYVVAREIRSGAAR
ncbi:hypothetical protein [Mycobacteroides abscessus]